MFLHILKSFQGDATSLGEDDFLNDLLKEVEVIKIVKLNLCLLVLILIKQTCVRQMPTFFPKFHSGTYIYSCKTHSNITVD